MKKLTLITILLLSSLVDTKACLNYYFSIDSEGHFHEAEDLRQPFDINFDLKAIEKELKRLETQLKTDQDYRLLSNYAVLLLKAGKTEESLEILKSLAQNFPNEYQIAANLGTAYELNGDVEKALEFIKKGMKLNPYAHEGSEWVHVKVLETKLLLIKDSTYLESNSVLGLSDEDFKSDLIRKQIEIQAKERFPFTTGPDPIMASIITDLGTCYAHTTSIEYAKALYTLAQKYYGADNVAIKERINDMIKLRGKYSSKRPPRGEEEGDYVKIRGIRYQELITNKNRREHAINWESIQLNADTLLSFASLKKFEPVVEVIEDTIVVDSTEVVTATDTDEVAKNNNYLTYYLIGGGVLIFLLFMFVKTKLK